MALYYRSRVNDPRRRISGAAAVEETQKWLSTVSEDERWDLAIEYKTKAALKRSLTLIEGGAETYCHLRIRPATDRAGDLALDLYRSVKGGALELRGGLSAEPWRVYADLPETLPQSLDELVLDPLLPHLQGPRWQLSFLEENMDLRSKPLARARIKQVYEAAATALHDPASFDEWCEIEDPKRKLADPSRKIRSGFFGQFPRMVSVNARDISTNDRQGLLQSWLRLVPDVSTIELDLQDTLPGLEARVSDVSDSAEQVKAGAWGFNTVRAEQGISKETIEALFNDEPSARQIRTWSFRAHHILWRIPDTNLRSDEGQNAFAAVQAPRESYRVLHMTLGLEDMDSPRFQSAIQSLANHLPVDLRDEVSWQLVGDDISTPRGQALARFQERIREVTRAHWASHALGPTASPLMDRSGKILRDINTRQLGDVAFKQTVIRTMRTELEDFKYSEENSWTAGGFLEFVRRSPSGARNIVLVTRDKYGGAFGINAAVSAFPCAEVHLDFATGLSARFKRPGWGLRDLLGLMDHRAAGSAWSWAYADQTSFEQGLSEAVERIRDVIIPLFEQLEPVLVEMRQIGRA